MPLVPAKCPNCGGNINIDSESRAGICEFCKNPFVAEDAINNYNTYNQNNYNIANAEVHIHDEKSIEQKLDAAEIFFSKHHDLTEARRLFIEVSKEAPGNYKAWWGLARIDTDDFHNMSIELQQQQDAYVCAKRAYAVADSETLMQIKNEWNSYVRLANQEMRDKSDYCKKEIENIDIEIKSLQEKDNNESKKYASLSKQLDVQRRIVKTCIEEKNVASLKKAASGIASGGLILSLVGCCASVVIGDTAISFIAGLILLGIGAVLAILNSVTMHQNETKLENARAEIKNFESEQNLISKEMGRINMELLKEKSAKEDNITMIDKLKSQLSSWDVIK